MQIPIVFGRPHSLLNKEITVTVDSFIFYFHCSHIQNCHTDPLSISCFPFFAVDILPNGNQQTDLMSIDSLSTVTGMLLANEKTPERQFSFLHFLVP